MIKGGIKWDRNFNIKLNSKNQPSFLSRFILPKFISNMYIGSYTHTIDNKNRLSIPKKWHKQIGQTIVLTSGLDGSIFLYDIKSWQNILVNINNLSFLDKDSRNFARFILANAFEIEIDSHGRILIPENLKLFAKLDLSATLIGVGDRIEIWNTDNYEQQISSINTSAEDLAGKIYNMTK